MIDLFAQFATDETAENEGVWVPLGDSEFLIARTGNRTYSKKLAAAFKSNQRALDAGDDAADALSDKIMISVIADTILLGWRTGEVNSVLYQGETLAYTKEAAKKVLAHKDFRRQVMNWAEDMGRYKAVKDEDLAKN